MHAAIAGFPGQILHILDAIKSWKVENAPDRYSSILILGMGGSAIGGDLLKTAVGSQCKIPIMVNRSYTIPAWVNEHCFVVASSYSGNTEETLSAFAAAEKQSAHITVLSTGGTLTDLAIKKGYDLIKVPGGLQPRAALGYSFTALVGILLRAGFITADLTNELGKAARSIRQLSSELQIENPENEALQIARKIHNTLPVIYGVEGFSEVAALRFRGQLAENAKMLAWHFALPEQNHNEIEGWTCNPDLMKKLAIVWLADEADHPRVAKRREITSGLLNEKSAFQITLHATGDSPIERLLKLIHLLDWISYYTALLNEIDPTPVNRIMLLKGKMSN